MKHLFFKFCFIVFCLLGINIFVQADDSSMTSAQLLQNTIDQAQADYSQWCSNCHGQDGLGVGEFPKLYNCFRCKNEKELIQYIQAKMPHGHKQDCVDECAKSTAFHILNTIAAQPAAQRIAKKVTIQRLNKNQYNHTVQDLFSTNLRPADDFPSDDHGYGFDRIGDVLSISPVQFELYLRSAQMLSDELFQSLNVQSVDKLVKSQQFKSTTGKDMGDYFNLWSNGEVSTKFYVVTPGAYNVTIIASSSKGGDEEAKMAYTLNDQSLNYEEVEADKIKPYQKKFQFKKGMQKIGVEFLNDFYDEKTKQDRNLFVQSIQIQGPIINNELKEKAEGFIFCDTYDSDITCLTGIIQNFASKVWRRNIQPEEVGLLIGLFNQFDENTKKEEALKEVFNAVLVSPNFIFRLESLPTKDNQFLSHYEIASRLSYFIWDSNPDEILMNLAKNNQLHDVNVIKQQVKRMLLDDKSQRMVTSFAGQWLFFNAMDEHDVNMALFPKYNFSISQDLKQETSILFRDFMLSDQPFSNILSNNYTYLNDNLKQYYGIKTSENTLSATDEKNSKFEKVFLNNTPERFGLLSQGSILTTTSHANRTSVVKRGKWVLSNLLCQTPPPPPPAVEGDLAELSDSLTLKQKMKIHASDPVCQSCHVTMDAIGFAFEHYDAIGLYRQTDNGLDIDSSGELGFRQSFDDAQQLSDIIKKDPRFNECVIEKLYTFATNSGVSVNDAFFLKEISKQFNVNKNSWLELMQIIATSDGFLKHSPSQDMFSNQLSQTVH
ncbi:DUF1592 domain-containing protein [Marinicellulosiphila megalodicopiae]|uniref:DUF1592 domain-containing protein n=1 Tax=Marinicellulosiphila megalodicopiae TaxID=2724896 RepID=UPI003BB05932